MSEMEIRIRSGDDVIFPRVQDSPTLSLDRFMTPGKFVFKIIRDATIHISNGNIVVVRWDGYDLFFGVIFNLRPNGDVLEITAYDQLRYLKNKDNIMYKGLKLGGLIQFIANRFELQTGTLADTSYKIPPRIENGQTLADMIKTANDMTLRNTGKLYVVYDDFGKITLRDIEDMRLDVLVEEDRVQEVAQTSSIDSDVYNQIKLYREDKEKGKGKEFFVQDEKHIEQWGVLQYYEKLRDGENGQKKAEALLELYNHEKKSLTIKGISGDVRVRGGVSFAFYIPSEGIQSYYIVDSVVHTFGNEEHTMDVTLSGGGQ